jgi:hypothetical protein
MSKDVGVARIVKTNGKKIEKDNQAERIANAGHQKASHGKIREEESQAERTAFSLTKIKI